MRLSRATILSLSAVVNLGITSTSTTHVDANGTGMSNIRKGPPPPPPPPPPLNNVSGANGAGATSASVGSGSATSGKKPLPPPPPPPNGKLNSQKEMQDGRKQITDETEQKSEVGSRKSMWEMESGGVSAGRYQEQITTREQVERFAKGFRYEDGGDIEKETKREEKTKKHYDTIAKAEEAMNVKEEKIINEDEKMQQKEETNDMGGRRYDGWAKEKHAEEQEWIIPKQMQFQSQQPQPLKLHQPGPPPPQESFDRQLHRTHTGQMPRMYPQRPLPPHVPPPQRLAPRNYDYHKRGATPPQHHHHQQQRYQHHYTQQHQQQHGKHQSLEQVLVPRRPQGQPPPGHSLLQRFGKTLDSLADVDTVISQRTQQIAKTVSSSSGSIAGGLSDVMRRGVFEVTDGVTGIKESLKDTVKGRMRSIFGGAPTSASEARDEWEDDRRRTVTERRRKAILGDRAGRDRHDGPGETFTGQGDSPLQQHLSSLASSTTSDRGGEGDFAGSGAIEVKQKMISPQPQHQGGAMDAILGGVPSTQRSDGVSREIVVPESLSFDQDAGGEEVTKQDLQHPFVKQTYPPNMITSQPKESYTDEEGTTDEDEPIHSTPGADSVDPSTFFISSPSSVLQRPKESSMKPISSFTFEDERPSLTGKLSGAFRSITSAVRIPSFRRRSSSSIFDDSGWSDDEGWGREKSTYGPSKQNTVTPVKRAPANFIGAGANGNFGNRKGSVNDLLQRRLTSSPLMKKDTANLLSSKEIHQFARVGRSKAVMDVVTMAFLYVCLREVLNVFNPPSLSFESLQLPQTADDWNHALQLILQSLNWKDLANSWAPFAVIAAFLSIITSNLLCQPKIGEVANDASRKVQSNLLQSQLYLRLASGKPMRHGLSEIFRKAVQGQGSAAVEISRLQSFVLITLAIVLAATVTVVQPICTSIITYLMELFSYDGLREWPIDWGELGNAVKDITLALGNNLYALLEDEYHTIASDPMSAVVTASFVGVLFFISQLSFIERTRSATALSESGILPDSPSREDIESKSTHHVSSMGTSSATRLELHMQEGSIERILARWQFQNHGAYFPQQRIKASSTSKPLQKLAYFSICVLLALIPIFVQFVVTMMIGTPIDWSRFSGIVLALFCTTNIAIGSLFAALQSSINNESIASFLSVLANTAGEVESSKTQARFPTASSPGKGLEVSDLWAAHVTKRAWACRGVTVSAKAGEIVLILGDESSGKTRLLTAIGETIAAPPKRSRTTTLARGKVAVGGVETSKWHSKTELRRKVGVMLNDVRSLSDASQINSGLRLQEILRPTCAANTHEGAIQSAVTVATQFTGLSSSLLPRLPEKLNSVITANEDELQPTNPSMIPLSTTEWSKVMLTKLIAQMVLTNDNPLAAPNSVKKSLVGSVLLLDDVTNHFNEMEEIKLMKALKSSGAATLMTSRRWATGRFADKIVIMRNGSMVESGTHSELLAKGANTSIYAKMWAEMTS